MPAALAIPAVTTLGHAGVLLAHATGLTLAFLVVAALLVGVALSGGWLRT